MSNELKVDPARKLPEGEEGTGFYVRVKLEDERWGNADIVELDTRSLVTWINQYSKASVISAFARLLGHNYEEVEKVLKELSHEG